VTDEARRATGAYQLDGRSGEGAGRSGEGAIEISDAGVTAGPIAVELLDVESIIEAERVLTLTLWPEGELRLWHLARRHDTFTTALGDAWVKARVTGMLAHGVAAPERFDGALVEPEPGRPARLLVYATHLTVAADGLEPFQIPFGAMTDLSFKEDAWRIVVDTTAGRFAFGQLARRSEQLFRTLAGAAEAQERRLAQATGLDVFADGTGVPASRLHGFDAHLGRLCAPERLEGARWLASRAGAAARLGVVELLDPDSEGLAAAVPLPSNLATFLIAPVGEHVVLELLSGPSAATYVFGAGADPQGSGAADAIEADLRALHFRRGPLALAGDDVAGPSGRPYRLALRKLEPLRRLRAATVARVVHTQGWRGALESLLG